MLRAIFKNQSPVNMEADGGDGQLPRNSGLSAPAHTPTSSHDSVSASRSASPAGSLNARRSSGSNYGTIDTININPLASPSRTESVEPQTHTPVTNYESSPIDGRNNLMFNENQEQDDAVREEEGREGRRKKERQAWPKRFAPYLELENSGSVARDHLALERTFLAYVRTSLAISSAGIVLVQLFSISTSSRTSDRVKLRLTRFATPFGATMIGIGLIVLLIGLIRYFRVQGALIKGKFHPAQGIVTFLSIMLASVVVTVFSVLVHASP